MPRVKTTAPPPSREKGQRSIDVPLYLDRILPMWRNPDFTSDGNVWRQFVNFQPLAIVCRETLIANIIDLDWKIEPKDSTQRDEHKKEIEYYEDFFNDSGEYDWTELLEWIGTDLLDIPFGSGVEVIREGDNPNGKVLSLIPLDGATLFPTHNSQFPVGQYVKEAATNEAVYFPYYAINRVYFSPRPIIRREGWGLAPPEKIFLAIQMMNRGDVYYANLLLDTPAAGILDLGDMAKDSAEEWVKAWKEMLTGIDAFKIPVLYEHETKVDWIPFTKNPSELMFDKALFRYGAIVTAGYGISLSDVGIPAGMSGGETLAGTIRQERQTRRTGFGRLKKKVKLFFDRLLPKYLEFKFIDLDDELNVALGRARLATSTAIQQLIAVGAFTPEELRQQIIADGLITISVPEKLPAELKKPNLAETPTGVQPNERPGMLGRPVSPSGGGHGEVKEADLITEEIFKVTGISNVHLLKKAYNVFMPIKTHVDAYLGEDYLFENTIEGDLVDVPEITDLSIDIAKTNYGDPIKFNFDTNTVLEETKSILEELYKAKKLEELKIAYVKSEIEDFDEEEIDIVPFDEVSGELAEKLKNDISETLMKSVIIGTYRFALDHPLVTLDTLIDENVVNYIRKELDSSLYDVMINFTEKISNTILEKTKGDINDG